MLLPTVVATPRRGPVPRPPELVRDATRLAAAAAPLEGSQECASAWSREARVVPAAGGSVGLLAGFLAAASSSTANASSDASRRLVGFKDPFQGVRTAVEQRLQQQGLLRVDEGDGSLSFRALGQQAFGLRALRVGISNRESRPKAT